MRAAQPWCQCNAAGTILGASPDVRPAAVSPLQTPGLVLAGVLSTLKGVCVCYMMVQATRRYGPVYHCSSSTCIHVLPCLPAASSPESMSLCIFFELIYGHCSIVFRVVMVSDRASSRQDMSLCVNGIAILAFHVGRGRACVLAPGHSPPRQPAQVLHAT